MPKHQRHFDGFDEAIVSLYARGLGVRGIQQHLLEIYKVEVSTALITDATEAVAEEVKIWQSRTLDAVYPIVYFDAIVVKIRHDGKVANRAIHLALAISMEGKKEVLGMWSAENEGARFWLGVATELKNRGLTTFSSAAWMAWAASGKRSKPSTRSVPSSAASSTSCATPCASSTGRSARPSRPI